jgi:sugar O-acyltransferase (sialic acid O-acetyltransferase NeuD family)
LSDLPTLNVNKKIRLGLIGARKDGQAGVVLDVLSYFKNVEVVAFFDHTPELKDAFIDGVRVFGCITDMPQEVLSNIDIFHISMGDNEARLRLFRRLKAQGLKFLTIVHPTAVVSNTAIIGEGCFIGAQVVIQNNVTISNVTLINTSAVIEHDNVIGEAVHVAPRACTAGRVRIGNMSFIGLGAVIIPDIVIGELSFIAAGSVIAKNVSDKTKMIGYIAKAHTKNIYTDVSKEK